MHSLVNPIWAFCKQGTRAGTHPVARATSDQQQQSTSERVTSALRMA